MGHRNHRLQASQAREDASGVPVWGPGGPVPPACTAWAWDQNREGLPLSQPRPVTLHHPRLVGWSRKRFLSEQKSYVTAAAGVDRDRAGLSLPQPSAQLPGSHSLPPSPCCRFCVPNKLSPSWLSAFARAVPSAQNAFPPAFSST